MSKTNWSKGSKEVYQMMSAMGKLAIQHRKANGEQMHRPPLGFKNARDGLGRSVLVKDHMTYPFVQEIFWLRRQSKSIRQICKTMEDKGLRSPKGKPIGVSSMEKILKRPIYSAFREAH
jgi:Recombinase